MTDEKTNDTNYHCAYCKRPLGDIDETCECGNALGVVSNP